MAVRSVSRGIKREFESHFTVMIYERKKYARVDWDYFRLPEENDSFFKERSAELSRAVEEIYLSCANAKSVYEGSGLVGHMDDVLIEDAHRAALDISNLFDKYVHLRLRFPR